MLSEEARIQKCQRNHSVDDKLIDPGTAKGNAFPVQRLAKVEMAGPETIGLKLKETSQGMVTFTGCEVRSTKYSQKPTETAFPEQPGEKERE
jgi:hypothetical protein